MYLETVPELLIAAQSDGTALANTVTATSLLPGAAKLTLPPNWFRIGRKLRVRASGRVSNIVTTPGTLTLDVRLGAVVVANGGAMALNIVAKTNVTWRAEFELLCRAIGSGTTANLMWSGYYTSENVIGSPLATVGGSGSLLLPASAMAVGTGFDSTAAQVLDFFGKWSIADAANSIQLHTFDVTAEN